MTRAKHRGGEVQRDATARRRARQEVVDVLAEALWRLIIRGQGPTALLATFAEPYPEAAELPEDDQATINSCNHRIF